MGKKIKQYSFGTVLVDKKIKQYDFGAVSEDKKIKQCSFSTISVNKKIKRHSFAAAVDKKTRQVEFVNLLYLIFWNLNYNL